MKCCRCLLLVTLCLASRSVVAAEEPAEGVPELKALSNYVGTWDVAIDSNGSGISKGEAVAMWTLGGRFVEQSGTLKTANGKTALTMKTVMTYDERAKAYRSWSFFSNGMAFEAKGKWDPEKKTMTSNSQSDDTTITTTADFSKEGVEQWKIVTTNQNGGVVSELKGTNIRQKK